MEDLPTFTYSGKKVKIHEGGYFLKNELKSRLHMMGIDFDLSNKPKKYFEKLYNEAIQNNANKIKIFDRLLKDTNNREFVEDIKQNNRRNNPVSYNGSAKDKQMNIMPNNIIIKENKDKYLNNRNNSPNLATALANQIKINENQKRINAFDYERNAIKKNEINFEQNMVNNGKGSKINLKSNNNYINLYNNIDTNIPTKSKLPREFSPRKMNLEKYNFNQFSNEYNNKPYIQYDYNNKYIQNNINFDKQKEQINYYNDGNIRNENKIMNVGINRNKNFIENQKRRENYNNDISIQVREDNQKKNYKNQNTNEKEMKMLIDKEEFDNDSNYFNKNNMDLMLYIILLVASAFLLYFVFRVIFHIGNAVTETVNESVRIIASPRRLFRDLIWGLIKSILLGFLYDYIHITLPMAIISLIIYKQKRKKEFEKLCRQIMEDIKKDLENKKDNSTSEIELINYYSKKYNIDKDTFSKKYFKKLKELRKKDPSLKISESINDDGEMVILWELVQ